MPFNKPLFVWFGVLALFSLILIAFLGLNMRYFGRSAHKTFAFITLLFALVHFILGAYKWLFKNY
ncbi:MAG: hypothetical protein HY746_09740 [Elusimicrobia bacterium]|nr:hypothetical protein [Elusimicrobiota bacterium]